MKCVRIGLLAIALAFAGSLTAQDKSVGYDVGSCSAESFVAVHVELGTDFVITEVSPGPDRVVKLEQPIVYKFVKEDKDGKHYSGGPNAKAELVITQADKDGLAGSLVRDGKVVVTVFGVPADGSNLAENAKDEYGACKAILDEEKGDDLNRSKS